MAKTYTKEIKQRARNLRSRGWSLGEINRKIQVPKNTLSGWVKDIRLTEKQRKRIKHKEIVSAAIGRAVAAKLLREKMEKWKEGIRKRVKYFEKTPFNNPEMRKLICGLLYLCEGVKYLASRFLYFGNTDPKIISFFLALLRRIYNIDEKKLRFDVIYRWDQDYERLKNYWSKVTEIPKSQSFKSKPDIRTKGKPTLRKDYKGVCRIIYCNTSLQFELQSIGEAIIKNGAYWRRLELVSNTHR